MTWFWGCVAYAAFVGSFTLVWASLPRDPREDM